ncbi:MAG TPA: BTAD domain-containing putative transcriptional regulator [Gemmatimonadales bacterium]|nr:BTAD domain-containing putative transcriptional regulator [Gemmatimonadales bacterium]
MLRFRMLGTVDLEDAEGPEVRSVLRRPKLLALLGYLAAARPRGFHRRDTLVAVLWPELDNAHARNALRQAVHSLREALGRDALLARGEEELGLNESCVWCDVRAFDGALDAGQTEQALELYGGGLLTGLHVPGVPEFERWLDEEREDLRRRACRAAQVLSEGAEAAGRVTDAVAWARRLTDLSPFDETALRRLVELLDRGGDRAGAVRAYGEFERRLERDLEVEPSSETHALMHEIRARKRTAEIVAAREQRATPVGVLETDRHPIQDASRPVAPRQRVVPVLALVVVVLLMGALLLLRTHSGARRAEAARSQKRLVVLPFTNLGPSEDEYLTDGVTEEISARLAAIHRLRVIEGPGGNPSQRTKKTAQQIGSELGADYILEGRLRWQKQDQGRARLRVTPQLISAADGTILWAEVYDEPLDEIFKVQSDVAHKVVAALDVTLLEPERRLVEATPTGNLQAYDYYLRGKDYMHRGTEERFARTALRMYEKAVELDPGFALAYAELSQAHTRLYWFYYDHSEARRAKAKRAADKAFELDPGLPEAHEVMGFYFLGTMEYDDALREFDAAAAGRPSDSRIYIGKGAVWNRQGNPRLGLVEYERALQLDPGSPIVANSYAQDYDRLREFARAEPLYDRAIALSPDWFYPYFWKAGMYLRWDGATRRARAVLDESQSVGVGDNPLIVFERVLVDVFDHEYDAALGELARGNPEVMQDQFRFIPRAQLCAQLYGLTRRYDMERSYYDSARVFVSRRVQERPDDPRLHSALGIAYAGLGRRQEAIQEGRRATELMPVGKEAYRGYYRAWDLARIYTMVGEYEAAIAEIEHLLAIPGHLTVPWLRIDPTWDPLRGDPRFRKLISEEPRSSSGLTNGGE